MANPNDIIRDAILRELYEIHQKARSPKSTAIGIKDFQSRLRPKGYKQQEVSRNLDYLVQKGWVTEIILDRTYTTPEGTTHPSEKRKYKISDIGIDKLEGASTYKQKPITHNINITNIKGVTVVGDGNIINMEYGELSDALTELRQAILNSTEIQDQIKLETISDIDSLQSQLQKPEPNKSVVKSLWSGVKAVATINGLTNAISKVSKLISQII